MPYNARPHVLYEASLKQLKDFKPNVAVLPWGATEAHNFHLPHGCDCIEGTAVADAAVSEAVKRGAKCLLLPTVPYGNDNLQLGQVATITMRSSTQQIVLRDIAESLSRQGIERLVVLNFHGGNEFKQMIRDVMLDVPIFIVQIHGYLTAPKLFEEIENKGGDHADEFETSLMLHLTPDWVAPLSTAGPGKAADSKIPSVYGPKGGATPGVWAPRDWSALTADTGVGDPSKATAEKGKRFFNMLVEPIVKVLVELSAAKKGDFPFIVRDGWKRN